MRLRGPIIALRSRVASNWFRHLHPRDDALLLLLLEMDVPCVTDPCNRARNNRGSDRSVALGYVNKRRWPANVIDKGSSAHLPKVTMHSGSLSWGVRVKHRRYKHRPINLLAPLGNETESSRFFFLHHPDTNTTPSLLPPEGRKEQGYGGMIVPLMSTENATWNF